METKTSEQVIEVSAKAPVVDKRKTSSGRTLDETFLDDVPVGARATRASPNRPRA
jgi:hypothetical protein